MRARSLTHLTNGALLAALDQAEARDRAGTVELLDYLAEVDRRRLYVPAGYPSMFVWCVDARRYSESMAARRIAAARAARRFPVIRDMLADGRLHLSAVALLSKKLTPRNAAELLAAATHRSRRQIEGLLAERFPQAEVPTQVHRLTVASSLPSPVTVNFCAGDAQPEGAPARAAASPAERPADAPMPVTPAAPAAVPAAAPARQGRVTPLAPQRFGVQFTMDEAMHADLVRAQELLGPQAGEDRVREIFSRALRELVTKLEKTRFAATSRPNAASGAPGGTSSSRHVPAAIRREVWARDQGRCTFVAANGRRCEARGKLEFDHVVPVARGGRTTVQNLRLLCRAHNQFEAGQIFGEGFMHEIRERARWALEVRSARAGSGAFSASPPG